MKKIVRALLMVAICVQGSLSAVNSSSFRVDDLSDLPATSFAPSVGVYDWVTEHPFWSSIGFVTAIVTTLYVYNAEVRDEVNALSESLCKSAHAMSSSMLKKIAALKSMCSKQCSMIS